MQSSLYSCTYVASNVGAVLLIQLWWACPFVQIPLPLLLCGSPPAVVPQLGRSFQIERYFVVPSEMLCGRTHLVSSRTFGLYAHSGLALCSAKSGAIRSEIFHINTVDQLQGA